MIDLHCHILSGIDDGPSTLDEGVALARAARAAGVQTVVATPHVSPRYPNSATSIASALEATRAQLGDEQVELNLKMGAEVAMPSAAELSSDELSKLTLGEGPWLLIECPFTSLATGFDGLLVNLQSQGHRILLAHPERSPLFHQQPNLLAAIVRAGALTSITSGSLVGRFGGRVRRFTHELAREQLIHNVASDAHDCHQRPPGLRDELQRGGLDDLTEWLTTEVPSAILTGSDVPRRPAFSAPRRTNVLRAWRARRSRTIS